MPTEVIWKEPLDNFCNLSYKLFVSCNYNCDSFILWQPQFQYRCQNHSQFLLSTPSVDLHCNTACLILPHFHFRPALVKFRLYKIAAGRSTCLWVASLQRFLPKVVELTNKKDALVYFRPIGLLKMCHRLTHTQGRIQKPWFVIDLPVEPFLETCWRYFCMMNIGLFLFLLYIFTFCFSWAKVQELGFWNLIWCNDLLNFNMIWKY